MSWHIALSIVILLILMFCGIPVPIVFFATTIFLMFSGGYSPSFLFPYAYKQISTMTIMCIPLFIMAGGLIECGGIGDHLIRFVDLFLGRFKAGLGFVMIVSCMVFGAISGSAFACETVMGSILIPRMKKAGYDEAVAATLLASACLLGSYIPPSGFMLMYAWITGTSVLACFLSTVIPGFILATSFAVWMYLQCRKNPYIVVAEKLPMKQKLKKVRHVTWEALPALLFPVIVLGGIYGGFMTTTEAAAVSVLYALPVGLFIYKHADLKKTIKSIVKSGVNSATILFMLFCVSMLSRIFITEDLPSVVLGAMNTITSSKAGILIMINLFMIFLGLIMDDSSAMLLSTPIFYPIVTKMGVDPIHYACILSVNLGLGCISPPCAPILFMSSKISQASLTKMLKPNFGMMFCVWLPIILLVNLFPEISLWLPRLIMGYGA